MEIIVRALEHESTCESVVILDDQHKATIVLLSTVDQRVERPRKAVSVT